MKRLRFHALLAFLGIVLFTISCTKPAESTGFDWPQWRGPDGNGQSRETDWDPAAIANPNVLWQADVGSGYSHPVIKDGKLYAVGMKRGQLVVSCLDAATGRSIWKRNYITYSAPQATPCIAGDRLFVLTTEGYLYALDAHNGGQQWSKDIVADFGAHRPTYSFAGSPIAEGDLLILVANTSGMAIYQDTGELAWTSDKPPRNFPSIDHQYNTGVGYATPVVFDGTTGRQALLLGWDGITSVDVKTGSRVWHFPWDLEPGGSAVDPMISGNVICVALAYEVPASQSGFLLDVEGAAPRISWRTPELFAFQGYPLFVGNQVYAVYGGPNALSMMMPTSLRCYDIATGRVLWEEAYGSSRGNKSFSLAEANGVLIILDDLGTLSTADASSDVYKEVARCDVLQGASKSRLFWTPPVLCNAKIYCRNYAGDLVCIDVSR